MLSQSADISSTHEKFLINYTKAQEKIKLTTLKDVNKDSCCNYRESRNIYRVALAGGLSAAGEIIGGFFPDIIGAIIAGAAIGGIGNGVSTLLAWETKRGDLVKTRILKDFHHLTLKIALMDHKIQAIKKQDFARSLEGLEEPEISASEAEQPKEKNNPIWIWNHRYKRNAIRLLVAGTLSGAGGCLAGFWPTTIGILAGSALSGIGNAASTWLAFEKRNDGRIREVALKELKILIGKTQKYEKKLNKLIRKIHERHPEFTIEEDLNIFPEQRSENDSHCWILGTRGRRNFIYVNTAGWLSAAGGLISGFVPNAYGITVGSFVGAAANAISTWLAWENRNNLKVKRMVLEDFSATVGEVNKISKEIQLINRLFQKTIVVESHSANEQEVKSNSSVKSEDETEMKRDSEDELSLKITNPSYTYSGSTSEYV